MSRGRLRGPLGSIALLCSLPVLLSGEPRRPTRPAREGRAQSEEQREREGGEAGARRPQRLRRGARGLIAPGAYDRAVEQWQALRAAQSPPLAPPPPPAPASPGPPGPPGAGALSLGTLGWKGIGPTSAEAAGENDNPFSGRINAIALQPGSSKILYVGTSSGGVWKSLDAGKHWAPLTDDRPALIVGSLATDPAHPETLFVGTGGEGNSDDDFGGEGLLRTVDGGKSWETLGQKLFHGAVLGALYFDAPTGALYVAAGSGVIGKGDTCTNSYNEAGYGLYRSSDMGESFQLLLPGPFTDMAVDPTASPRVFYLSRLGSGGLRYVEGEGAATPLVGLPEPHSSQPPTRIAFSVSPARPEVVYAGVGLSPSPDGSRPARGTVFVSTNRGASFSEIPGAPNYCRDQCDYDNVVLADPGDPAKVYVGGSLCTAFEGSAALGAAPSWTALTMPASSCAPDASNWIDSFVHVDVHAMLIPPDQPQTLYIGSDGGLARTTDGGASWERLNDGLSTLLFYGICLDPSDPNVVYGGTQDNGSLRRAGSSDVWQAVGGGDGITCAVDPTQSSHVFLSELNGLVTESFDGGQSGNIVFWAGQGCTPNQDPGCGDRLDFSLLAADVASPGTVYFGTYRVWKSKPAWAPISPDLTAGPGSVSCATGGAIDDTLAAIAPAPSTSTTMYTGSAGGVLSRTTNGGASWTTLGSPLLPPRFVGGIAVDPHDARRLVVGYSGFDATFPKTPGHLFHSEDGGASWERGAFAVDVPVDSVAGHPLASGVAFAGTDVGVAVTTDGGEHWAPLGEGLPRVAVYSLAFHAPSSRLVAGTFGRSVFSLLLPPRISVPSDAVGVLSLAGQAHAADLSFAVKNAGVAGSVMHLRVSSSAAWLSVKLPDAVLLGGEAQAIHANVSTGALEPGEFDAALTFADPNADPPSVVVPVHLSVPTSLPSRGAAGQAGAAGAGGAGAGGAAAGSSGAPGAGGHPAAGASASAGAGAPGGPAEAPPPEPAGGCGCRQTAPAPARAAWLLALGLGLGGLRRRSRRAAPRLRAGRGRAPAYR